MQRHFLKYGKQPHDKSICKKELDNVVLNIAMDLYRSRNFGQQQIEGTVKSITEGDVSVAFDTGNCMNLSTSDILKNYKIQLDRYRRMGW